MTVVVVGILVVVPAAVVVASDGAEARFCGPEPLSCFTVGAGAGDGTDFFASAGAPDDQRGKVGTLLGANDDAKVGVLVAEHDCVVEDLFAVVAAEAWTALILLFILVVVFFFFSLSEAEIGTEAETETGTAGEQLLFSGV